MRPGATPRRKMTGLPEISFREPPPGRGTGMVNATVDGRQAGVLRYLRDREGVQILHLAVKERFAKNGVEEALRAEFLRMEPIRGEAALEVLDNRRRDVLG